jgi:putative ABC transport system substrate-binding protein
MMKRRTFITTVLGGVAAARPLAARAQTRALPVIGFLHSAAPEGAAKNVAAFREGLRQAGYVEGQNVTIEYRWAENQYNRLPALAADLVERRVAVIVTSGATVGPLAVKQATSSIPIVFMISADPIYAGLVESLNQRRGNVTGVTFYSTPLGPKRLELLHELAQEAKTVACSPTRRTETS